MRTRDIPEQRKLQRRRVDPRVLRIVSGRCDSPAWMIDKDRLSHTKARCGRCLPCRVHAKIGPFLAGEILRDLVRRGTRRRINDRRRKEIAIRFNRRGRGPGGHR